MHDFRFKLQLYLLKSRKRTPTFLRNQFENHEHVAWLEHYLNREYGALSGPTETEAMGRPRPARGPAGA